MDLKYLYFVFDVFDVLICVGFLIIIVKFVN